MSTSLLMSCAHDTLNVKHHRTTPKRETHITVGGRSFAGEKMEHQHVYKLHSHQPPSRHHHVYHPPHDSKPNYWVELVPVCRLAVVAAAAACCSCCDNENPPLPNEARANRREGRRAISAQPAGRQGGIYAQHASFGRTSMSKYPTCSNESR